MTTPTTANKPILELTTLAELPSDYGLRIDGEFYFWADSYAWSLFERGRFAKLFREMVELEQVDEPDERQAARYLLVVKELTTLLVPSLPEAVYGRLKVPQLSALVQTFLAQSRLMLRQLLPSHAQAMELAQEVIADAAAKTAAPNRTGAKSSRASSASTGARRRNGR